MKWPEFQAHSTLAARRPAGGLASRSAAAPHARGGQPTGRWAWAGLVLGGLMATVAFLPAAWVAGSVGRATQGRVLLSQPEGSLWNGSALAVLTGGPGSRDAVVLPSRLGWRLRPFPGGLRLHLAQECCLGEGLALELRPGWGRWTLAVLPKADGVGSPAAQADLVGGPSAKADLVGSPLAKADLVGSPSAQADLVGQWPAACLAGLGAPWNTLQPGGLMRLTSRGLTLHFAGGRVQWDGQAQMDLLDASSRMVALAPLGSYRLTVQGAPAAVGPSPARPSLAGPTLNLQTLQGALLLSGSGEIGAAGLRFRGEARAAPGSEAALNNLMNIIGKRNGALTVLSIG